jgi:hypothetical protein
MSSSDKITVLGPASNILCHICGHQSYKTLSHPQPIAQEHKHSTRSGPRLHIAELDHEVYSWPKVLQTALEMTVGIEV